MPICSRCRTGFDNSEYCPKCNKIRDIRFYTVTDRPIGVSILASLYFFCTAILAICSTLLVLDIVRCLLRLFLGFSCGNSLELIGYLLVFAFFSFIFYLYASGLWRGRTWAYWLTLAFTTLGIIVEIASPASSQSQLDIVSIAIKMVIIIYFLLPSTKAFF
jgi:uncharacterized membrane protein (DUF2068 family)